MKKLLLNIFTDDKMIKNKISFSVVLLILLFSVNIKAQHFESVTITGVASGNGSQNALFIVTCPTVPSLTRMRVEKVSGAGTVQISRQTAPAARTDNFTYTHNTGFTSGIPNNVSRMKITFLQTDGVTPIPANDFRLVIDDIDGPNNEGIYTDCGSSVRFTSLAIPTDLTLNTTPPNLGAVGTATENGGPQSRIMFEYNDVSSIFYTIYANNGFIKEFDLNYDDFLVDTPKYAVCVSDFDGDGVADNLDLDDDNDGILDLEECGGNDPNGDADGDGLPNYLDTLDNRIAANNFGGVVPANYISSRDSSVTNYTDTDGDGVPDVYDSSADADSLPNHLDLDSDGDGCFDAVEGDENVTPTQLLGTGAINTAANGGIGSTVNVNNGVPNLVNSGGAADIGADVGQGTGNSLNASLKDPLCYTLTLTSDSGATATGTTGVAFTVPNILTNDTLNGITPVIGSNPGQVAISQTGVWPAGITLNTATGQVNVGSLVPAGTYNVTYQVCVNGTSPALCTSTTVTIVLKADSDGDLLADDIDLDDDNDGILDTNEGICTSATLVPTLSWIASGTQSTATSSSGISVTYNSVPAVGSTNTDNVYNTTSLTFNTTNFWYNSALAGAESLYITATYDTTPEAQDSQASTDSGTRIVTLTFSQPIDKLRINVDRIGGNGSLAGAVPQTFVSSTLKYTVTTPNVLLTKLFGNSQLIVTPNSFEREPNINIGVTFPNPGEANYTGNGTAAGTIEVTKTDGLPFSTITFSTTGDGVEGPGSDGLKFIYELCKNRDTDFDGIPDYLDTDSDGDGCADAIEGAGSITASQVTSDHINGTVDANGVPTAVSGGQAIGQSVDATKIDCLDTDGDGFLNWQDLDDDNDGILDTAEVAVCGIPVLFNENFGTGNRTSMANTTYVYEPTSWDPFTSTGNSIDDGEYALVNSIDDTSAQWSNCYWLNRLDHTPNDTNGRMALFNASFTAGEFYRSSLINVPTNAYINFDFWAMNVDKADNCDHANTRILPDVQIQIRDASNNLITQFETNGIPKNESWNKYNFAFNTSLNNSVQIVLVNHASGGLGNDIAIDDIVLRNICDLDGDGIPNDLDTDSDGDGCPDAIEGDENVTTSQLTGGSIDYSANGGVGATAGTNLGVPNLVNTGGSADVGADVGQGIGQSENAAINSCFVDAQNDINQVPKGSTATGSVLTNDSAIDGSVVTVTSATYLNSAGVATPLPLGTPTPVYTSTGTLAGTMTLNSDGTYTFIPTATFIGTLPINYTSANTSGSTDSATLSIEVLGATSTSGNDNPIAQNDTASTEVETTVSSTVLANDSDPDGNVLTVSSASIPLGTATTVSGVDANGNAVPNAGTLTLNANGTYTFVPTAGFTGYVNPVTYTVSDGNGRTDSATLSITVMNNTGNDTYANDDANSAPKGTSMNGNVLTNDTDPEGNSQLVTSATINGTSLTLGSATVIPGVGSVTLNSNGTYTFVPLANFIGTLPVVYTVCDTALPTPSCDTATLYLTSLDLAVCYKPAQTTGTTLDSNHGITALGRAGADNSNWPMVRKGAWTVLESKTKGFVVNRLTDAQLAAIPSADLREGMMVYNITQDCLQINVDGTATGWKCFNAQTCPD